MKKQFRQSVFETNSSSTHALNIRKTDPSDAIKKYMQDNGKTLNIRGGSFGWEFETYDTPDRKLSYVYTLACSFNWDEYLGMKDFMKEALQSAGFEPIFEEMKECKYSADGESFVEPVHRSTWDVYIDHSDELKEFADDIFSDKSLMLDFIFNEGSFILTGNDNVSENRNLGSYTPKIYENSLTYYKGN